MLHELPREADIRKNKQAMAYTAVICGIILLLFFIIKWKVDEVPVPIVQDLIEINLGNDEEGFGEEQPLIRGERSPSRENIIAPKPAPPAPPSSDDAVTPEESDDKDAAPVVKPNKNISKPNTNTNISTPAPPKPQKPKITYNGPGAGGGNNATEDNGYRYQGQKPGGTGDAGSPEGDKDSYGNTPGGKTGGPRVTKGNRKIVRYYSFTGELNKATIYAIIKVSPSGQGSFVGFDKGSTSRSEAYANAIRNYLRNIQFDKGPDESTVTVQFNFNVN